MTDGEVYEIHHPELVIVPQQRLDIGVRPDEYGVVSGLEYCALLHVVRIGEITDAGMDSLQLRRGLVITCPWSTGTAGAVDEKGRVEPKLVACATLAPPILIRHLTNQPHMGDGQHREEVRNKLFQSFRPVLHLCAIAAERLADRVTLLLAGGELCPHREP